MQYKKSTIGGEKEESYVSVVWKSACIKFHLFCKFCHEF